MPIYEYHCPVCGANFDVRLSMNDKSLIRCPICRSEAKRRMSVVNHTFGFRLTEESHIKGNPDEYERDV